MPDIWRATTESKEAGALTVSGQGFLYQLDFRNIEQRHGNTVHRKAHYKQWLG